MVFEQYNVVVSGHSNGDIVLFAAKDMPSAAESAAMASFGTWKPKKLVIKVSVVPGTPMPQPCTFDISHLLHPYVLIKHCTSVHVFSALHTLTTPHTHGSHACMPRTTHLCTKP